MKKKVEEKKEIIPILQPGLYWEYIKPTAQLGQKVDTFITTFNQDLKGLIQLDRSLPQNYQMLCAKIGTNVHPSLARKDNEKSEYPNLKNNDYGDKYATFMNHKVDIITLKLFAFLITTFKINCLKLSNNNFQEQFHQIKKLIEKEDNISSLYFEWNPLSAIDKRGQIFIATIRPTVQHLILRQCRIGDQICKELLKKIKQTPDSKIKSLDLYGNALTNQISNEISNFIEENKVLEFIGISKNALNSDQFLTKLFNSIGEIPLSEQQFENHKQKQKARDEVNQRNKKRKKGAPEEPVPFVFEVKQTPNGRFYVKNISLKILNISSNGIKDSAAPLIRKFVENQGKSVQIFIEGNKFTKASKEAFKFYENVIF